MLQDMLVVRHIEAFGRHDVEDVYLIGRGGHLEPVIEVHVHLDMIPFHEPQHTRYRLPVAHLCIRTTHGLIHVGVRPYIPHFQPTA